MTESTPPIDEVAGTDGERFPTVALHNVGALSDPDWTDDGLRLDRVPERVAARLNVAARERVRHPGGCEVRFVPESGESVAVTLSAPEGALVRPFWGAFQGQEPLELGPGPQTVELRVPEPLQAFDREAGDAGPYDPRVCRLRFDPWVPVALHDVAGDCRPPLADELPDHRYLAYGTSITEGAAASASHLTYVARVARQLAVDPLNLGMSGSAFCEPVVAEHVAGRDDWDLATLALSVNMANRGFTVDRFRERAENLVETVATAHPEKPVLAVSLFTYHADVRTGDDRERARAYREALRGTVDECGPGRVSFVDGRELTTASGLTTDLLHPGDAGMGEIADGLAAELRGRL